MRTIQNNQSNGQGQHLLLINNECNIIVIIDHGSPSMISYRGPAIAKYDLCVCLCPVLADK